MAGSADWDPSADTMAGLRGGTRDPSGLRLDSIVRSGDTLFSLNHPTMPTHLSDWLSSRYRQQGIFDLRIAKLTKSSVPTKSTTRGGRFR